MAAHSGELRGIGRQGVIQNIAIHSAGHHGIQRGINLAVALALDIGRDCGGLRADSQGGIRGRNCVIRVGTEGHGDRIGPCARSSRRGSGQGVVQNIPINGSRHNRIKGGIDLTIRLALAIDHNRGRLGADCQRCIRGGDRVIRIGTGCDRDRIGAGTRSSGGSGGQGVIKNVTVQSPCHNSIERGIGIPVALALGIGGDGDRCGIDRKAVPGRGDRVVRIGAEGHSDRVAAHSGELGRVSREAVVEAVPIHSAGDNGVERGIHRAERFALRIGNDRGGPGADRQSGIGRGDTVVRVGSKRDCDRIRAST